MLVLGILAGFGFSALVPTRYQGQVTFFVSNPTSVSYTHLRAHETVLDLVCRLLLEKKKKPYKYPL